MADEFIPDDRIDFYARFASEAAASAVEAIADSVEQLTGNSCDHDLKQAIADTLSAAFKDYATAMREAGESTPDLGNETATKIVAVITESASAELERVEAVVGLVVLSEVSRFLQNVIESLARFYRDALIDSRAPEFKGRSPLRCGCGAELFVELSGDLGRFVQCKCGTDEPIVVPQGSIIGSISGVSPLRVWGPPSE